MEDTSSLNPSENLPESNQPSAPSAPNEAEIPDLPPMYESITPVVAPSMRSSSPERVITNQPLKSERSEQVYPNNQIPTTRSQFIAKSEFPIRSEFVAKTEIVPMPELIKSSPPAHNDEEIQPTPLPINKNYKASHSSEPFPEPIEVQVRENKSLLDAARAAKPPHLQSAKKVTANRTEPRSPTQPTEKIGDLNEIHPSRKDSEEIKPVSQTNSCLSFASFDDAESDNDLILSEESSNEKISNEKDEKTELNIDIIADHLKRPSETGETVLFGFLGKTKVISRSPYNVKRDLDEIQPDLENAPPLTERQSKKRFVKKYGVPSALECLEHIDMLFLERIDKTKINVTLRKAESMFAFKNRLGEVLFHAVEAPRCLPIQYCASGRPFIMKIYDKNGEEVINFSRKMSCAAGCIFPCMWQSIRTYSPPNVLIGTVEEDFTFCIPKYTVYSSSGASVVTLRGPIGASIFNNNIEFLIYQRDSLNDIGLISERWNINSYNIYRNNVYGIQFPLDLNVKVKILLMSAATLINYIYYRMPQPSDFTIKAPITDPSPSGTNQKQFGPAEARTEEKTADET